MARNPYFRRRGDTGLEEGLGNLANMFAPPTPQDVYAGAKVQESRQKVQHLQDLYRMAQDPNFNQQGFDRLGAAVGQWNPSQGYYAQDQNNATKQRGDDLQLQGTLGSARIGAAASMYGHDRSYDASTQNNVRDNTRAVTTNTADNDRARDVAMLAPVAKDATRFVPPDLAGMYNVPATQTGVVAAQPGERNVLPDGREVNGAPKPLSTDEFNAITLGKQSQRIQDAAATKGVPIHSVNGQAKTTNEVLEGGQAPDDSSNVQVFNYTSPDGRTGNARIDRATRQPVDAQTGQPLPQGSSLQGPSGVGKNDVMGATMSNMTEGNRKAAQRAEALQSIDRYAKHLQNNPGVIGLPGAIRGTAQNALSVVQEFSSAFGNTPLDAVITPQQAQALASRVGAGTRDAAIAQARVMQLDLAYKMAQAANPTGEVSRQALERQLEALTGGMLSNNASALEALQAQRDIIAGGQTSIDLLRKPQPGDTAPPAPQGGGQQLSPEDAAKLPPGTPFIGMDGVPRVRQ